MGVDIYAHVFCPHWDIDLDYDFCHRGILPEGIIDVTREFETHEFPSFHQIWSDWRNGISVPYIGEPQTTHERIEYMNMDLNNFWITITTPESANNVAHVMEHHYRGDSSMQRMACWLRYWASVGASFYSG
jgi:hypothetical protein